MEFREYQAEALLTDQLARDNQIVPLLGMAGEVGSLLVEYKKHLRDGDSHALFPEHVAEELGDILWYLANTATKFGVDLDDAAAKNLAKTRDRWPIPGQTAPYLLFDGEYGPDEQLPRQFIATIVDELTDEGPSHVVMTIDGVQAGDHLRDNSHDEDGYRFHDVFHLAHAAKLGWSPVLRGKLFKPDHKRRSQQSINDVEDGGRAIVLDEAIVAYVWEYARRHRFLEGVHTVDYRVLKTIKEFASGLEVSERTLHHWEEAILAGYEVWRGVVAAGGGVVKVDLVARTIVLTS